MENCLQDSLERTLSHLRLRSGHVINVEELGEGEPVILLHGFMGSSKTWQGLDTKLSAYFHILSVDIIGHGETDKPENIDPYFMEEFGLSLVEVLELRGISQAHWIGYSMGGRLALFMAGTHANYVKKVAVIGASPGIENIEERKTRVSHDTNLAKRIEDEGLEKFVNFWEKLPLFESQLQLPQSAQQKIREGRLMNDPIGLANSLRGMGTGKQPYIHNQLQRTNKPILLLTGSKDQKFIEIAKSLEKSVPNAETFTIPNAGHAAHLENQEDCATKIIKFLTK